MSELQPIPLEAARTGDVQLCLQRYVAGAAAGVSAHRRPVLLLHGASANHATFLTPGGGLASFLADQGFDPFLLDWRGSGRVVADPRNAASLREDALRDDGHRYTINVAARVDVPAAISAIREVLDDPKAPINALGFCMGSAVLAEAVALGHVGDGDLDRLVLMTLGLFYEAPIDGRIKSEERVLEQLRVEGKKGSSPTLAIDPHAGPAAPWPPVLEELYELWPTRLRAHWDPAKASTAIDEMCNRVSFMYGMPYQHRNLVDEIHGSLLPDMFGGIPLQMYLHGAQNIRRGQATYLDGKGGSEGEFVSKAARDHFMHLSRVTLMTGGLNRLWHRDSIDRMYEWLRRGRVVRPHQVVKEILPDYGHQDLLWGKWAARDVYGRIAEALR